MISNCEREYLNKKIEELKAAGFFKSLWNKDLKSWCILHSFDVDGIDINLNGITKIVVVIDNSKYVIKFSSNPFGKTDFCHIEANNYKRAVGRGLEDYFAETFFFKRVDGIDLYLQEKVDCDSYSIEDNFFEYAEKIVEWDKEKVGDEYNDAIWELVEDFGVDAALNAIYGEGYDTNRLIRFCGENKINDLHQGNLGYKNGFPVIIDFSGIFGEKE